MYQKEHKFLSKRKNSNPKANKNEKNLEECGIENSGVDLNRNYGEFWSTNTDLSFMPKDLNEVVTSCLDECSECYRGKEAFSEPETRAIRDFLTANKNEIKFVYNFHSYGNLWTIPFNGKKNNDISEKYP